MHRPYFLFVGLMMSVSLFAAAPLLRVDNGVIPPGKAKTLRLTEELRVAADQGNHAMWIGPTCRVEPDYNGHMYVLDTRDKRVIEFDETGKMVRLVGGQGAGPGEFQGPRTIQIFPDRSGMVHELSGPTVTMNTYSPGMIFQKRHIVPSPHGVLANVVYGPDKKHFYCTKVSMERGNPKLTAFHGLMNPDAEPLIEVSRYQLSSVDPNRMSDPNFWVDFLADRFRVELHGQAARMAFDGNGNFYAGLNGEYVITQYNSALEPQKRITRKYKPRPMTEAQVSAMAEPIYEMLISAMPPEISEVITPNVVQRALKKAEPPAAKPPVNGLLVMEDGTLLVIFDKDLVNGRETVDIYNPEGVFIGQVEAENRPFERMVFRNGKAYTLETVDGENELVRYSYVLVDAE